MSESESDVDSLDGLLLPPLDLDDVEAQSNNDLQLPSVLNNSSNNDLDTEEMVNNRTRRNNQNNDLPKLILFMNILCHFILLVITIIMVYKSFAQEVRLFSFHPSLMTVGFFALMSEAILGFSNINILHKWNYKNIVFLHWILQTTAGFSIIVGFIIIYILKIQHGKEHFTTYHGIFGLISVIMTGVAMIGGIFTKYAFQLRKIISPLYMKISHAIFGALSFIFGLCAIILGFYTHWFTKDSQETSKFFMSLAVIIIGIYVLFKPIYCLILRIKSLF